MRLDVLPFVFEIDSTKIAGACLWSLALYITFSSPKKWVTNKLVQWFNFAERTLYNSEQEYEATRPARESQNAFYASVFSIIPFLVAGGICNWLIDLSFGGSSWAIALGLMSCMLGGLLALASQTEDED